MLSLPAISGRFPVGVTTFVTPVRPARGVGSATLKSHKKTRPGQSDHAFFLEEVAYSVYYPANVGKMSKKGVPWFLRPLRESLIGLSSFTGLSSWLLSPIVYCFGAFVTIPAFPNAPLLDPSTVSDLPNKQWPLVVFSHGLGGGRTIYSQLCCELAASGRVVLAIEHRDGTAPVCMPRGWQQDNTKTAPRVIHYLRATDLELDENDEALKNPLLLRAQQLSFRHHEVHATYSTFCRFLRQDPTLEFETIDGAEYHRESWLAEQDSPKVNCDGDITLAGHSFGGCTILSLLSTEPLEDYSPIPVTRTLILDPWLEPLPTPGPVPFSKSSSHDLAEAEDYVKSSLQQTTASSSATQVDSPSPKMLVINSEQFTVWKDHYARLKEVLPQWEGSQLLTIVGSRHHAFSDFVVLPVIAQKHGRFLLDRISQISLAFLDDNLDEELKGLPVVELEERINGVKKDGKPKRELVGNVGDIIVQ